jgi:hypothetical protein
MYDRNSSSIKLPFLNLNFRNPYDKKLTRLLWTYAGWLSIFSWIAIIGILSDNGFLSDLLPPMRTEDSNLVAMSILLVPIAIISFQLIYKMDFHSFTTSRKPLALGSAVRALYAVTGTLLVLVMSWYIYWYFVVTLYLSFR